MEAEAIDQPERPALPAALTTFVGRERELDALDALLRANRLVTLLGVGGCGKTRLALEDRFDLLSGGPRTALPRHQTLRASVDWSHDLLSEDEQVLLRRLSVFLGGFDLDGVVAVAADPGTSAADARDRLASLVDKSLVQADDAGDAGDEVRYRMLETIRQYAAERLRSAGEDAGTAARHRAHLCDVLARAAAEEEGPDQARWRQRVLIELDNVRGALASAHRDGDHGALLDLTCGAGNTWTISGQSHEHRRWLQLALATAPPDTPRRGPALYQLAITDQFVGEWAASLAHLEQAVPAYRRAGDRAGALWAESERAFVAGMVGGPDAVEDAFAAAEAEAAQLGADGARYSMTYNRATLLSMCGRHADACAVVRPLFDRPAPVRHFEQWARCVLGVSLVELGHLGEAAEVLESVLAYGRTEGDGMAAYMASIGLVGAALAAGDPTAAAARAAEVAPHAARYGPYHESLLAQQRACVALTAGDPDAVVGLVTPAIEVITAIHPPSAVPLHGLLAAVHEAAGDLDRARGRLLDALPLEPDPRSAHRAGALLSLARVEQAAGSPEVADAPLQEALATYAEMGHAPGTADALDLAAGSAAGRGAVEEAARLLGAAEGRRRAHGLHLWHPGQREARDRAVESVRARLDEEPFAACWAAGLDLSVEDACACAAPGRGPRRRAVSGWDALTPAEVRVAELVARGLTNAQVGEQLFISRHTVDSHLRHIYAKLGVSTRAALAGVVVQRDGVDA